LAAGAADALNSAAAFIGGQLRGVGSVTTAAGPADLVPLIHSEDADLYGQQILLVGQRSPG
jgi:hypothetical protein